MRVDAEFLQRFADTTRDPSPSVRAGTAVPALAVVPLLWEAQGEARPALTEPTVEKTAAGVVHGEHAVVVHRPLRPGEPLRLWAEGHSARPAGRNALVTIRYTALDRHDAVVVEQWWTTAYVEAACESVGEGPPEHRFPEEARQHPVGTYAAELDAEMARRYAELSGDWSEHHFSIDGARRSGFERPFLHGLCTMALCGQAVTQTVAGGDPERVRSVAVRFASPAFLGEQLTVELYDAGPLGCAFEANTAGAAVVTHGRATLR